MQLLIHLPEGLGERFKRAVPSRSRSAFVRGLLEAALPAESDPLYLLALEAEREASLGEDLSVWEEAVADGLDAEP